MEADDENRSPKALPKVVEPGRAIPIEDLPKKIRDVIAPLEAAGRRLSARKSKVVVEGTEYLSGAKKGQRRPDKAKTNYSFATTDLEYPVVTAVWIGDTMEYARVWTRSDRSTFVENVTTLKAILKGEVDGNE